ncbi:MAG: hypothetical protein SPJ62_17015 [Inconstantimicrobium porci]|uniref:hypothetical protein n=1 Tax=Inconstantimicrobium porci TaxID=2652291 RepID=UPI00240A20E1|nr:hypothetical protein [Inconstantimicrobium porci]MDD6769742.1 hypothetical protein [Inconstantimicrobium porci]MDY5913665.1 hypothetical protein [Inconstantimicrobium porci]
MAIVMKFMNYISIILLVCTLICGAWIEKHPKGNVHFHAVFSAISVIIALVVIIMNMRKCRHCKKGL